MSLRSIAASAAVLLAACVCIAPGVALASPEFGVSKFTMSATNAAGEPFTQAGGHPYEVTSEIVFNTREDSTTHTQIPVQEAKGCLR